MERTYLEEKMKVLVGLLTAATLACLLCQVTSLNIVKPCWESDQNHVGDLNRYKVDSVTHSKSGHPCGKHGICLCKSQNDAYFMNCSHKGLREVSNEFIPVNITEIYFDRNCLTELPSNAFSCLPKLQYLKLSYNNLVVLHEDLFQQQNRIKVLLFNNNTLQKVPALIFRHLFDLNTLSLAGNKLKFLDESIFSVTENIKHLYVGSNYFKTFPANIFRNLRKMQTLYLRENFLTDLPENIFRNLTNLKFLDLSSNKLYLLHKELFAANTNITHLYINNNKLSTLPRSIFRNLVKLKLLDLSYNKFSLIQEGLFHSINSLEALYLSNNNIKSLGNSSFDGLTTVGYLSLYGNNLNYLPGDLFNNINLSYVLDLSVNNLAQIPRGLFESNATEHGLKLLLLQRNKLSHLQNDTFKGLPRLRNLLLSNNPINIIEDDAFTGTDLEKIFVHCDQLIRLPSSSQGRIHCVTQKENQNFTLSGNATKSLEESFQKQGFRCKSELKGNEITCFACMLGTYGDGTGNCLPCPKGGFYQNEMGSTDCKPCNDGSFVEKEGGTSPLECNVCPEGTEKERQAGYRGCSCKSNYTRMDRFGSCSLCTIEGLNCSEDYMTILPGYYWNWSFPKSKGIAYLAFVENLKIESQHYSSNTTQYNYSMPMVIKCPRHGSCVSNDTLPIHKDGCAEGYRGWLCTKCQRRYYSILNGCYLCPTKTAAILILVIVLLFCVALISFIVWSKNRVDTNSRTVINKLYARIKIVLGFYQVTGDLFESFSNVQHTCLLNVFENLASFTDFFEILVRPQCINEHFEMNPLLRLKVLLTLPIALTLLTALTYFCCTVYLCVDVSTSKRRKLEDIRSRAITFAILVIFVTYTPTCNSIFTLYPSACAKFHIYSDGEETISLLRADYDISCDDLTLYHIAAYVATICYVIAFPSILFMMLWTHNFKQKGENTHAERSCSSGDLTEENRPLLGLQRTVDDGSPIWFNFLSENYRKQFWYWEVVELARKCTQTLLVTILGWRNSLTRLLTIGLSVLFLTIHIKYCPMKNGFEHRLQVFSLTAIFLNTLVSSVQLDPEYSCIVYIVLAVIDMFIIIIVAAEALIPFIKYLSRLVIGCSNAKTTDRLEGDNNSSR